MTEPLDDKDEFVPDGFEMVKCDYPGCERIGPKIIGYEGLRYCYEHKQRED